MTNKEMTIAVLDLFEKLESERAALAAFVSQLRDLLRQQPDWRTIAADKTILETVQAKHAELRRSILLANDDDCPRILVEDMAKRVKK